MKLSSGLPDGNEVYSMLKRILGVLLAIAVIFSLPCMTASAASSEKEKPRVIHVVYDDSTSMYRYYFTDGSAEYYDKWCYARYSMEVFSALMGEEDTMAVYPVNRRGKAALTLHGSESPQERVDKIHGMIDSTGGTPYTAVEKAAADLAAYGEDVEKWLVILTDGDFTFNNSLGCTEEKPLSEINADLSRFAGEDIRTAYLAIGKDIRNLPDQKASQGIYVWEAAASDAILHSVTAISNTIFERQQLPGNYLRLQNGRLTISPDVPMEQIVIFAQGDDVSLSGVDSALKMARSASVRYNDSIPDALWGERDEILVARDLSGLLMDFRSSDSDPIPAGDYTFDASGVSSVQVYYKPSVTLGIRLTQDGQQLTEDPIEGDVQVEIFLQDPVTGERLDSAILQDVTFSGTLTQNGASADWSGSNTTLTLQSGDAGLHIRAELPGYNYVEQSFGYDVRPALGGLVIRAEPLNAISAEDLPVPDAVTYTFFRVDPDTGAEIPLTDEELKTLAFVADRTDPETNVTIRYGMLDDTVILYLDHARDKRDRPDPLSTFTGTFTVHARATFERDGQKGGGEVYTDITICKASFLTMIGWFWDKWKWLIIAVILLLLGLLYIYLAYIRTAKFLKGRKGLNPTPQMSVTTAPGTIRAKTIADPVQTCSVQLDQFYLHKAFHAQRANVIIGCRGTEHFRFQTEAVNENGKHRMRPIGLLEQLNQPIYSNVTIDGIELARINPTRTFGYHMQIRYRKAAGRKVEEFDIRL